MSNLSVVDMAWYQMEEPTNLMMVTGLVLFKEKVKLRTLREVLNRRMVQPFAPFHSVVVTSTIPGVPYQWEKDKHFDLSYHIRHISLPDPGGKEELQTLTSNMMSTALDLNRSPWQIHLIDNYCGGSAVMTRIHHCMGDGISLIRVLLSMTGVTAQESLRVPAAKRKKKKKGPMDMALKMAVNAIETTQKVAQSVIHESQQVFEDPAHLFELGTSAAEMALKGATATGKLLLMPPDPHTPLKGDLGLIKLALWSKPIDLIDIKRIGKVTDSKVNDVLLAAMSGALRRYLAGRDFEVEDLNIRAAVPVNLRPLDGPIKLGNEFGLVFLSLPLGVADPYDRLLELKRRMDQIKGSVEAVIAFGILGMLGVTPGQIADQIVNIFGTKSTAVATNVPGPRTPIFMAGKEIDNMMFWVPQSGKLGLGISIFSYAGKVTLGVAVDRGLIPDPEKIISGFHEEFEALKVLADQVES